jgi:CRP/FNR family cyclic AMP-dependent transcriptional regulator
MPGRYWLLKHNEVLAALSVDELRRLESRSRAKWFAAGSPIYLPSDLADGVLLLTEGRVRICSTNEEGKRAILSYVDPGELFGELSLLGDVVRDELAEAVERSQVILMPRDEIQRVMQGNARLTLGITKLVGLRRQRIERRLKSLLFRSVGQRLADLLLELAERYGKAAEIGVVIDLRLSHQEMASAIGSTRESVTLLLGEWTAAGIVAKQRNRVTILALERLRRLAENIASSGAKPPVAVNLQG